MDFDANFWNFTIRLSVAFVLGAAIGLDRTYRAKDAGFRTHILVCVGSALMMIISQYGFSDIVADTEQVRFDPARIAAQVVSGIGFLGAGTIILQKHIVRGLTTAAGLWATAGIGLAAGSGMYAISIVATILTLLGLELFPMLFKNAPLHTLIIQYSASKQESIKLINDEVASHKGHLVSYETSTFGMGDETKYRVNMAVRAITSNSEKKIIEYVQSLPDVFLEKIE